MPTLDSSGAVDIQEDFGDAFDDVLDELHANPSQQHEEEPGPKLSRKQLDDLDRQDRQFRASLFRALDEHLPKRGLRPVRVDPDGEGGGYRIEATDNCNRYFEIGFKYEDGIAASMLGGTNGGQIIVQQIVQSILDKRAEWFRRGL